MKKSAKVLYVLYFVSLPVMLVMYLLDHFVLNGQIAQGWMAILIYAGIGLGLAVLFGGIAHILIARSRAGKGDCKVSYILTFPPYILLWILLIAFLVVVKFIDIMIGLFTGGEKGLGNVVAFLVQSAGFSKKPKTAEGVAYTVVENGSERVLILMESKQDADPDSPYYTKTYNRFRDDIGNYWRSYDNNEHFVKETAEQLSRGY